MPTTRYDLEPPIPPRLCPHDEGTYDQGFDEYLAPGRSIPMGVHQRCNRCHTVVVPDIISQRARPRAEDRQPLD